VAAELPGVPIHVTAVEVDEAVIPSLEATKDAALGWARERSLNLEFEVVHADFIQWAACNLIDQLDQPARVYDLAIMNPPYAKIAAKSRHRVLTTQLACEVTNLYAAFVALALQALCDGGRLVAITPRSFTNGPYFRQFRNYL